MKWRVEYPTRPRGWPPEYSVIENRSMRVLVFGWLRLLPVGIWLGGLILIALIGHYLPKPIPLLQVAMLVLAFAVPIYLDRSRFFDPAAFIAVGPSALYVKHLAQKRAYFTADVLQVELRAPAEQDHDDIQRIGRFAELVIRFRRSWPIRLLVGIKDVAKITAWAATHGVPVIKPNP